MLSYQHDYHAGSHADVLKHSVLAILIRALQRKKTPMRVIDTHAGSGEYDLKGALAQRGREFEGGAARVFAAPEPPACIAPYLEALATANPEGELRRYPGSPLLAWSLLRAVDQLELFELHPQALAALRTNFRGCRQVHIHRRDGLEGLLAVVPPKERRGLALIDPSYERKTDFALVAETVARAHARWTNGVLAVWYPLIAHSGSAQLLAKLGKLGLPNAFRVELEVAPAAPGLRGSGLVIVNLPYEADREFRTLLPWLARRLGAADARSRAEPLARRSP